MQKIWKLFWDIMAVVVGIYIGWQVFLFFGRSMPMFGFFPVGLIAGLLVLWLTAYLVHGIELLFNWLIWKLFKIKMARDLPFETISVLPENITKKNANDYSAQTVALYNSGNYETALIGFEKLSKFIDTDLKIAIIPHIERCKKVLDRKSAISDKHYQSKSNLISCKYCGKYTPYIDPNEPTFGFANTNNCSQCGRMYPIPDFYWDSWEGLEYIEQRHSVPDKEFYKEYQEMKQKYSNEYNLFMDTKRKATEAEKVN